MNGLWLALALLGVAGTAAAQTKAAPAPGSASVKTQLQALHYRDVHYLRRGYDGQWTGKATENGVPKTVTISPKGVVTAR